MFICRHSLVKSILLDSIKAIGRQADGWQHRKSMLFGHAHDYVSATEIVEVVGKCAESMHDFERIPASLELESLRFDFPALQQIVNFEWQRPINNVSNIPPRNSADTLASA
jgi:hypothetical protein